MFGPWQDRVQALFPGVRRNSGDRSNEEQDRLFRAGATRLRGGQSPHNRPDSALDLPPVVSVEEARRRLRTAGLEGNVIYEGGGHNQGTGPHLHFQRARFAGRPQRGQARPPATASAPATPAATPEERTAMANPREWEIVDPFTVGERLGESHRRVVDRGEQADRVLQQVTEKMDAVQIDREAVLARAVEQKEEVNEEIRDETQQLIDQARPIFQRRQATRERLDRLQGMNPLARAVAGVFSLNHNEGYLRDRDRVDRQILGSMGEDYTMLTTAQDRLINIIEAGHQGQDAILQLTEANLGEDVRLASQSFSSAMQVFGAEIQGLESQTTLLRAQQQARVDTLTSLSPGQVDAALADARANNGTTIVNGVPLRQGELEQAQNSWREQRLALESRNLAVQAQRMDIADAQERRLIDHMTPVQLEQAVRDGGVYQGQQLSMTHLTQALAAKRTRDQMQVEGVGTTGAPRIAQAMLQGIATNLRSSRARMQALFGQVPEEFGQYATGVAARLTGFTAALNEANARGVGAQFLERNLPMLQGLLTEQQNVQQRIVRRWSGGNRDIEAVGTAWLSGQPLQGESAVRGLIALARGGLPRGTRLQGPAAEMFRRVQARVRAFDTPQAGQTPEQLLRGRPNQRDRDRELMRDVNTIIRTGYSDQLMESVIQATPEIARQVTVNGRPHPFSRVRPDDFRAAVAAGDAEGYRRIGAQLGIQPEQARTLFAGGPGTPLWSQVAASNSMSSADLEGVGRTLQAMQTQATLIALDNSPSASDGFRPSAAYINLLSNPQYQQRVSSLIDMAGRSNFGDFLFSNIGGSGFNEQFYQYSRSAVQGQAALRGAQFRQTAQTVQNMAGLDPYRRTSMVLAAIDGLSPEDERTLLAAVRPIVGSTATNRGGDPRMIPATEGRRDVQYGQIRSVILSHRFDDPNLERVRQIAARNWVAMEGAVDRATRAAAEH